jgi:hypothetical protein
MISVIQQEESVYKRIRESKEYRESNFYENYYEYFTKMNREVEAAKVYIEDNFKKVSDWSSLQFKLYGYSNGERNSNAVIHFGPPVKFGQSSSARVQALLEKLNEETVQVQTLDEVAYDWTDGDFSIKVNGTWYQWIDHKNPEAVIQIAHYCKKEMNKELEKCSS